MKILAWQYIYTCDIGTVPPDEDAYIPGDIYRDTVHDQYGLGVMIRMIPPGVDGLLRLWGRAVIDFIWHSFNSSHEN